MADDRSALNRRLFMGLTGGSLMVSVVVKPARVPGANADGARALQACLLAPSTQAQIRSIRYPGDERVCWVPAGRNNRTAMLPKG